LTTSVCKDSGEPDNLEGMLYLIAKGKFKEMDAIKVEIDSLEDPIYSFLSINFGFIADVDINSEFMRCLGELRFELYGAYRAIC
jgi:sphingosine kinase